MGKQFLPVVWVVLGALAGAVIVLLSQYYLQTMIEGWMASLIVTVFAFVGGMVGRLLGRGEAPTPTAGLRT